MSDDILTTITLGDFQMSTPDAGVAKAMLESVVALKSLQNEREFDFYSKALDMLDRKSDVLIAAMAQSMADNEHELRRQAAEAERAEVETKREEAKLQRDVTDFEKAKLELEKQKSEVEINGAIADAIRTAAQVDLEKSYGTDRYEVKSIHSGKPRTDDNGLSADEF